jgi:hypothetical protein
VIVHDSELRPHWHQRPKREPLARWRYWFALFLAVMWLLAVAVS